MKMSDTRSRRSGLGSRFHTPRRVIPLPPAGSTRWTLEMTAKVNQASTMLQARPARTPVRMPHVAIKKPPIVGATTMGRRRSMAWTENPIARRSLGRASPITANNEGLAMLVQAIVKTRPRTTTGQMGATAMIAYPMAARPTKRRRARRRP